MPDPSIDQWRVLYALAAQVRALAPWAWMTEMDLFGVEHLPDGRLSFVQVLGQGGEHFAVCALMGPAALHEMLDVALTEPPDAATRIVDIPQVQLSFEDRDLVETRDRAVLRELGLRFRGRHAWPLFRAYHPGFVPWHLEAEEAAILQVVLEQAVDVAPRVQRDPELLPGALPEESGPLPPPRFLVRRQLPQGWTDEVRLVLPPAQPAAAPPLDAFSRARFGRLPRGQHVIEADVVRLWTPICERQTARPYYPYLVLLVDAGSGLVVGVDIASPLPTLQAMWEGMPVKLLVQLEKAGGLPARVRVVSSRLRDVLEMALGVLDVPVEVVPELPALEEARQEAERAMGSFGLGPPP